VNALERKLLGFQQSSQTSGEWVDAGSEVQARGQKDHFFRPGSIEAAPSGRRPKASGVPIRRWPSNLIASGRLSMTGPSPGSTPRGKGEVLFRRLAGNPNVFSRGTRARVSLGSLLPNGATAPGSSTSETRRVNPRREEFLQLELRA